MQAPSLAGVSNPMFCRSRLGIDGLAVQFWANGSDAGEKKTFRIRRMMIGLFDFFLIFRDLTSRSPSVCKLADSAYLLPARHAPVLSVACNAENNTIVSGTELLSSQAVVAFW